MSELEEGYTKEKETGNMTRSGYTVEARYLGHSKIIGKQIFTEKWQAVEFSKVERGIPINDPDLFRYGLLTYPAAQSLRWCFHASTLYGLETRLVLHQLKIKYSVEAKTYHEIIGGRDSITHKEKIK